MQIKKHPYNNFGTADPEKTLARSLEALFMGRFLSLDTASISLRKDGHIYYAEGNTCAWLLLDQSDAARKALQHSRYRNWHDTAYQAYNDIHAVVAGRPPHAMSLLAQGLSLGPSTSMMKKRNVLRADDHVYDRSALDDFPALLDAARAKADDADMGHMLMIVRDWGVICCAPNLPEAIAHYQNIELLARLEVARLTMKGK